MAVRETSNLPGSIKSTDLLPNTRATLRCIDEEFGNSKSSGNPMITRTWEVVTPELVTINGEPKCLAGTKVKQYLTTIALDEDGKRDDAKSDKALARLRDENKSLGLPFETIDDENPELSCEGVLAQGTVGSESYEITEQPSPEDLALGKKRGAVKIGDDGKPVVGYRVKLVGIYGLA